LPKVEAIQAITNHLPRKNKIKKGGRSGCAGRRVRIEKRFLKANSELPAIRLFEPSISRGGPPREQHFTNCSGRSGY